MIVVSLDIKCFQIFYTKFSFPECFVAVYYYSSPEPGDLNFDQNEVIMVTNKDGEWWTGSIGDRTGIFPAGYVMKMDIPQVSTHVCNACNYAWFLYNSFCFIFKTFLSMTNFYFHLFTDTCFVLLSLKKF